MISTALVARLYLVHDEEVVNATASGQQEIAGVAHRLRKDPLHVLGEHPRVHDAGVARRQTRVPREIRRVLVLV